MLSCAIVFPSSQPLVELRVNTIKVHPPTPSSCPVNTSADPGRPFTRGRRPGCARTGLSGPVRPAYVSVPAVKPAVRLPSDGWFIISQTQACQPRALRHCAMHTKTDLPAPAKKPARLRASPFFFLFPKLSQFILMTRAKST